MTEQTAASRVANIEAELNHLRAKSDADDSMIMLLKQQLEFLSMDMTKMSADHASEMRELKLRRNEAVRNEQEINGILNTAAKGIVDGLRKMKGDATPAVMPTVQAMPAEHPSLPAPEPTEEIEVGALRDIFSRLPVNEMPRSARR